MQSESFKFALLLFDQISKSAAQGRACRANSADPAVRSLKCTSDAPCASVASFGARSRALTIEAPPRSVWISTSTPSRLHAVPASRRVDPLDKAPVALALSLSLQEFSTFLEQNIGIEGNKFTLKEARAAAKKGGGGTWADFCAAWRKLCGASTVVQAMF